MRVLECALIVPMDQHEGHNSLISPVPVWIGENVVFVRGARRFEIKFQYKLKQGARGSAGNVMRTGVATSTCPSNSISGLGYAQNSLDGRTTYSPLAGFTLTTETVYPANRDETGWRSR